MKEYVWVIEALYNTEWMVTSIYGTRSEARYWKKKGGLWDDAKALRIVKYYREMK